MASNKIPHALRAILVINKKPANFLKKSPAFIFITWDYKAVRKVNPPKITPAELGIIRIQSFFGSLVHP